MNKKSIEDQFSKEIDSYFNGIEKINKSESQEYNNLLDLGKILANKDFSKSSNKKAVYEKTLKNIEESDGGEIMKKSNKIKCPVVAAVAVCIMSISLMQSSFAQEVAEKVINKISLGHISVVQTESIETAPVPDNLKGKIFDRHGKPITVFSKENDGPYYTAKGEKIDSFSNNEIITEAEQEKMDEENILIVKDSKKLNDYTCFNVILPRYLPEGYKFDRAEFYKNEKGNVSGTKYVSLYFTNEKTGKYIFMQERFADKETGYEESTEGKIEKIKINGVDAIMSNDRGIDWEANGTLYSLSGRGEILRNEIIKIAESIK